MGKNEVNAGSKSCCNYESKRRDCDGDWDIYCTNYGKKCPYKQNVRDCDGDVISLCRK